MRKFLVFTLGAALLLSSCGTYTEWVLMQVQTSVEC